MRLKPIRSESEYDKALERVDEIMGINPEIGTKESDELEVLILLIERYEDEAWTVSPPDPIEAIKYRMEQMHLKQKDLVPYIGNKSKVSELLNRKISLSVKMIKNLSEALHIPLEVLIQSSKNSFEQHGA